MLNGRPHYSKAPIVEAVIDLRCDFSAVPDVSILNEIHTAISREYPIREELFEFTAQIQARGAAVASAPTAFGIRALSNDRKKIVGLGLQGFTFSELAPYDRWEVLRDEAYQLWTQYAAITKPTRITRVGVRFINRLDLPSPAGQGVELDQYFRTAPRIAPELPQHLESFFLRFQLSIAGELHGHITIVETGIAPSKPDVVSVLLDIDAFVQALDVKSADAWRIIEQLRDEKNQAFEACITDAVRDLIV